VNPEATALAAQVAALPGFAWAPGMRAVGQYPEHPVRVIEFGERPFDDEGAREADPFQWWQEPRQGEGGPYPGPYVPDLADPATAGILLGMLAATGRIVALTPALACPGSWYVELDTDPTGDPSIAADSLGVAVARALIAIGRCAA
jgi:hypothetical protein